MRSYFLSFFIFFGISKIHLGCHLALLNLGILLLSFSCLRIDCVAQPHVRRNDVPALAALTRLSLPLLLLSVPLLLPAASESSSRDDALDEQAGDRAGAAAA